MSLSPPPPPGAGSPSPPPPLDSALPSNPTLALPAPPQQQPQPSLNPRRLPPPCWSHDETVALIDAYRDKWYALRRGNLKANHWQDVADAVGLRCPNASPPKTAVQCRHKMEKLRKRYRNEIQRARSMPVSRFSSSWVHFKRMDSMEKGPQANPDYNSGSDGGPGGDDNDDDNEDDDDDNNNMGFYHPADNYKNGTTTAASILNTHHNTTTTSSRSIQKLYRNGIGNTVTSVTATGSVASAAALGGGSGGGGGSGSGGFRIRIPSGVSIAQPAPAPKFYAKVDHKYSNLGSTSNSSTAAAAAAAAVKPNYFGGVVGPTATATATATRVVRGSEETGKKREREPMDEMVAAVKVLGDGFVRMEQMKMEMARELETMRMEMEMKRTEMILESQQRIVEAFAKAFSEKQQQQLQKKKKKLPLPANAKRAPSSSPNS